MPIFSELGIRSSQNRKQEEFLYNMAACFALIEKKISRVLSVHGLSPVTMNALLVVKHAGRDKGLSQNEISKKMIVTAGNITRLIDRLSKDKFVERVPLAGDRRVNLIKITKKASDLLDKVWPIYKREVNKITSTIPDAKIVEIVKDLENLRDTLKGSE